MIKAISIHPAVIDTCHVLSMPESQNDSGYRSTQFPKDAFRNEGHRMTLIKKWSDFQEMPFETIFDMSKIFLKRDTSWFSQMCFHFRISNVTIVYTPDMF